MSELPDFGSIESVLGWVREQAPARRPEFTAIELLTDAPVEVRTKFIDELAEEYALLGDPEIAANPRTTVISNIGYIAAYYEPVEFRQHIYGAWADAEPTLEHPIFHPLLMADDTYKLSWYN
jgi:hypothetical protein